MTFELTDDELSNYQRDGFLVRERVFSAGEVVELCEAAERATSRAADLSRSGKTYILDGKRFVDIDHLTVQFEHSPDSETVRVIEPVHELEARLESLPPTDRRYPSSYRH